MESEGAGSPITKDAVIAGRYRLVERIAAGGMGEVWKAVDEILTRTVALKLVRPELSDDAQFRERLHREAMAASVINHVGVVSVYDYGEIVRDNQSPAPFIVMEYVDGITLSEEVAKSGRLDTDRTLLVLEQIASALEAAHQAGVVHRDVKPGNIVVTASGDLKITDFGIARTSDATPMTRTGTLTGTAMYLSPEQARGEGATPASDVYALGIVAYACLNGDVPFSEGPEVAIVMAHVHKVPPALPAGMPAGLRDLVMSMLEKDPARRPPSAGAIAAAARSLRAGGDATAAIPVAVDPPIEAAESVPETAVYAAAPMLDAPTAVGQDKQTYQDTEPQRRRNARVVAVLLLLLVAAALAFFVWRSGGDRVPDVVGEKSADAARIIEAAGFEAKVVTADVARTKKDIVASQDPDSEADKGSTIELTVATGKVEVPQDELIGADYDEAKQTLEDLGLKARRVDLAADADPGTVTAVDPKGRVDVGDTVTLAVAVQTTSGPGDGEPEEEPTDEPTTPAPTTEAPSEPTTEPPEEPAPTTTAPAADPAANTGGG